ncbi:hypothetical protein [Flavobacterium wongokense]|uniref:hypothetical protein n=1 Tax=Flavobacterium wongokense TaxID=2910674 RepID=UPI001F2BDFC5|nr:hypothetical protein [Flavobacterium sp. WG47]MCF6131549.1 hypothetical protein [Flavobacterium sp. WG47]
MDFSESFSEFYDQVKSSLAYGTFAKLTLAKTIGNTDLMNIYVRPIVDEGILKMELKYKFQRDEQMEIHTIDKAKEILLTYINNPFLSAILFTTEFDLTYKLNKKRAISIIESPNTFMNPSDVLLDYLK